MHILILLNNFVAAKKQVGQCNVCQFYCTCNVNFKLQQRVHKTLTWWYKSTALEVLDQKLQNSSRVQDLRRFSSPQQPWWCQWIPAIKYRKETLRIKQPFINPYSLFIKPRRARRKQLQSIFHIPSKKHHQQENRQHLAVQPTPCSLHRWQILHEQLVQFSYLVKANWKMIALFMKWITYWRTSFACSWLTI